MPFLKMYILNELVDTLEISFAGLEKEERPAHVEGLAQWMKTKNYLPENTRYEIFVEGIHSDVHKIITATEVNIPIPSRLKKKYRKTINKKEPAPEKAPEPQKETVLTRPKADHTNKHWWDDV